MVSFYFLLSVAFVWYNFYCLFSTPIGRSAGCSFGWVPTFLQNYCISFLSCLYFFVFGWVKPVWPEFEEGKDDDDDDDDGDDDDDDDKI